MARLLSRRYRLAALVLLIALAACSYRYCRRCFAELMRWRPAESLPGGAAGVFCAKMSVEESPVSGTAYLVRPPFVSRGVFHA